MYIQTKSFRLFSLYSVLVTSVLLMGCGQTGSSTESFKRSDYYTSGIGQYPGLPSEDFSPLLRPDVKNYRNIALLRSAYHSLQSHSKTYDRWHSNYPTTSPHYAFHS